MSLVREMTPVDFDTGQDDHLPFGLCSAHSTCTSSSTAPFHLQHYQPPLQDIAIYIVPDSRGIMDKALVSTSALNEISVKV